MIAGQQSLTQQQVTGIVNPTTSKLSRCGAVSKRIASATGPDFKQECQNLLAQTSGAVLVGGSAVTPYSGAIPVYHSCCWTLLHG